jgi:hypothetical protein
VARIYVGVREDGAPAPPAEQPAPKARLNQ